jgi:hypothetical protein
MHSMGRRALLLLLLALWVAVALRVPSNSLVDNEKTGDPVLDADTRRIRRAFAVFDAERLKMEVAVLRGAAETRQYVAKTKADASKKESQQQAAPK